MKETVTKKEVRDRLEKYLRQTKSANHQALRQLLLSYISELVDGDYYKSKTERKIK